MSPNQQFEEESSYKQDHWEYFSFLSIAMYKRCNPNMPNLPISQVGYSLCLIYYWIFIELYPMIQQKRRRPDATMYSRRRTNMTFYRPAKIILCIWRVGNRIFPTRLPFSMLNFALIQTFALGNMRNCLKRTGQKRKSQPARNQP